MMDVSISYNVFCFIYKDYYPVPVCVKKTASSETAFSGFYLLVYTD